MWWHNLKALINGAFIDPVSLCIEDGEIKEIREGPAQGPGIDLEGLTAIPGLVDVHGDMFEREIHPRPKANIPPEVALYEVDKRLANSGVTTAFAAISFAWHKEDELRSEKSARLYINTVNAERHRLLTDHYVHARFEITNPAAGDVLSDLLEQDQVQLVSVMDHTPGQGQYRDIEAYIDFSIEWAQRTEGKTIDRDIMLARIEKAQNRPKGWEAVKSVTELASKRGVPLASHDDDTSEKVAMMAALGVTMSEFPVTLEAAEAAKKAGLFTVMGGPNAFRGLSHSGNLSAREAIASGCLDALASDYYPPGMLLAAFKLAEIGLCPLEQAIDMVSLNAARSVGLQDRGRLAPGFRADIALIEMGAWPRVRATFREGVPIYCDGIAALRSADRLSAGATRAFHQWSP